MRRYLIFQQLFVCFLFAGRVAICLDPGHGGTDVGAKCPLHGPDGPYEKNFNIDIDFSPIIINCEIEDRII